MRKFITIQILIACLFAVNLYSEELQIAELPNGVKYIANAIIVVREYDAPKFLLDCVRDAHALTGVSSVDRLCEKFDILSVEPFYKAELKNIYLTREISRIYIFTLRNSEVLFNAIDELSNDPNIQFAELYAIPEPHYTPNDPYLVDQWFLYHTQALEAWDIVRGDTTKHSIIAIVDTGVDWDNPDMVQNIWINEPEDLNGNGLLDPDDLDNIDQDSNGFIDDVVGWDMGENDNDPREYGIIHGTSVASCASPATDNGIGIAGMGFSARIMCLKATNSGGQLTGAYQSIIYAVDNGAHVINCSWGTATYSQAEQNIINAAYSQGALIVASAGAIMDTIPAYPCGYDNVVAVTATDEQDHKVYFAPYGSWIDICAPGTNIKVIHGSGYAWMTGTSFSAAMVSGLAGLIWAWYPYSNNSDIELTLKQGADPIDHLNPGYEGLLGAGRINAANSVIITDIEKKPIQPDRIFAIQAYPNPFNAACKISVTDPGIDHVDIYDIRGRLVKRLALDGGEAVWDASENKSGVYFAAAASGNKSENIKMVLLK